MIQAKFKFSPTELTQLPNLPLRLLLVSIAIGSFLDTAPEEISLKNEGNATICNVGRRQIGGENCSAKFPKLNGGMRSLRTIGAIFIKICWRRKTYVRGDEWQDTTLASVPDIEAEPEVREIEKLIGLPRLITPMRRILFRCSECEIALVFFYRFLRAGAPREMLGVFFCWRWSVLPIFEYVVPSETNGVIISASTPLFAVQFLFSTRTTQRHGFSISFRPRSLGQTRRKGARRREFARVAFGAIS